MATRLNTSFREIDASLLTRLGWMLFSAMWVLMLPVEWFQYLEIMTTGWRSGPYGDDISVRIVGTSQLRWFWMVLAAVLVIAFVVIYLYMLFKIYVVRRNWAEHFSSRETSFIRWSLMVFAVAMNLLPSTPVWPSSGAKLPNWAAAFTFVAVAWAITAAGRSSVIAVLQVFGVAAVMQMVPLQPEPQWGTVIFGLMIGLVVAGQVNNQDLIGELYLERSRVKDQAVTDERFRIARDLHDTVGHSMTQITLKAELARRILASDPDRAARELGEVESLSRNLARDIRSAVAGDEHLAFTDEVVRSRQFLESMNIASAYTGVAGELSPELDAIFAWCVREGVMNVVKHADATRVEIDLRRAGTGHELTIRDNGTNELNGQSQGRGLRGMRERVQSVGGSVNLSKSESGHELTVRVPTA